MDRLTGELEQLQGQHQELSNGMEQLRQELETVGSLSPDVSAPCAFH
jgi:prefoldin subunit 5